MPKTPLTEASLENPEDLLTFILALFSSLDKKETKEKGFVREKRKTLQPVLAKNLKVSRIKRPPPNEEYKTSQSKNG